jgi:transposase
MVALRMRASGVSYKKITNVVGCSTTALKAWKRAFDANGTVKSKPRSGRPRKLADEDVNQIHEIIKEDHLLTQRQVAAKLDHKVSNVVIWDRLGRWIGQEPHCSAFFPCRESLH